MSGDFSFEPTPSPLAAQHFQLIIVDHSSVYLLLVPFPTDWWENFKKGQSDPYGGIPIYKMGGVSIPYEILVETEEPEV